MHLDARVSHGTHLHQNPPPKAMAEKLTEPTPGVGWTEAVSTKGGGCPVEILMVLQDTCCGASPDSAHCWVPLGTGISCGCETEGGGGGAGVSAWQRSRAESVAKCKGTEV